MPFRLRKAPRRELYWVIGPDGKHHSKDPIPKERAEAQMRALYAAERREDEARIPTAREEKQIEKKMEGGGPIPQLSILQQIAKASYSTDPPQQIGPFKLRSFTPTLKFYILPDKDQRFTDTVIVGIRGTKTSDKQDLWADAQLALGKLEPTPRWKKDLADFKSFMSRIPNKADVDVYGVGHSLGGAILDMFLKDGLIQQGVSYNPAIQLGDTQKDIPNRRIYQEGDPLLAIMGRSAKNVEVRPKKPSDEGIVSRAARYVIPFYGVYKAAKGTLDAHALDNFIGGTHRKNVIKKLGLQDEGHSIAELAKASGIPRKTLQEVYNRGIGAYNTQPSSVRMKGTFKKGVDAPMSQKLSKEQWAMARVYSFIDGNPKHDTDLRGGVVKRMTEEEMKALETPIPPRSYYKMTEEGSKHLIEWGNRNIPPDGGSVAHIPKEEWNIFRKIFKGYTNVSIALVSSIIKTFKEKGWNAGTDKVNEILGHYEEFTTPPMKIRKRKGGGPAQSRQQQIRHWLDTALARELEPVEVPEDEQDIMTKQEFKNGDKVVYRINGTSKNGTFINVNTLLEDYPNITFEQFLRNVAGGSSDSVWRVGTVVIIPKGEPKRKTTPPAPAPPPVIRPTDMSLASPPPAPPPPPPPASTSPPGGPPPVRPPPRVNTGSPPAGSGRGKKVCMPKTEYLAEHEQLRDVLARPTPAKLRKELAKQTAEVKMRGGMDHPKKLSRASSVVKHTDARMEKKGEYWVVSFYNKNGDKVENHYRSKAEAEMAVSDHNAKLNRASGRGRKGGRVAIAAAQPPPPPPPNRKNDRNCGLPQYSTRPSLSAEIIHRIITIRNIADNIEDLTYDQLVDFENVVYPLITQFDNIDERAYQEGQIEEVLDILTDAYDIIDERMHEIEEEIQQEAEREAEERRVANLTELERIAETQPAEDIMERPANPSGTPSGTPPPRRSETPSGGPRRPRTPSGSPPRGRGRKMRGGMDPQPRDDPVTEQGRKPKKHPAIRRIKSQRKIPNLNDTRYIRPTPKPRVVSPLVPNLNPTRVARDSNVVADTSEDPTAGSGRSGYLRKARANAKAYGLDPKKLKLGDGKHKLEYDGTGFGLKSYKDFLLLSDEEKAGKIPVGTAEKKRKAYLARATKIKGDWKDNKVSPNNLAIHILWGMK